MLWISKCSVLLNGGSWIDSGTEFRLLYTNDTQDEAMVAIEEVNTQRELEVTVEVFKLAFEPKETA